MSRKVTVREEWTPALRDLFVEISRELSAGSHRSSVMGRIVLATNSRGRVVLPLNFTSRAGFLGFVQVMIRSILVGDIRELCIAAEVPSLNRWAGDYTVQAGTTYRSGWVFYHERAEEPAYQVVCRWGKGRTLVEPEELGGEHVKHGGMAAFFNFASQVHRNKMEEAWRQGLGKCRW